MPPARRADRRGGSEACDARPAHWSSTNARARDPRYARASRRVLAPPLCAPPRALGMPPSESVRESRLIPSWQGASAPCLCKALALLTRISTSLEGACKGGRGIRPRALRRDRADRWPPNRPGIGTWCRKRVARAMRAFPDDRHGDRAYTLLITHRRKGCEAKTGSSIRDTRYARRANAMRDGRHPMLTRRKPPPFHAPSSLPLPLPSDPNAKPTSPCCTGMW